MPTAPPPPPPSPPRPSGRKWGWAFLALVLAAHTVQAVRLFPGLRSIVDPDSPVIVVDHAIHEYHGALGAGFVREAGTSWGYDPFFMAGYPETPVWDSSSNPSILFDLIGGGGFRPYKVGLLACSVFLLVAVAAGARVAGLGAWEVAGATALAFFGFWGTISNSLWRSGLFAFVTASAGSVLLMGLCVRFDRRPTRGGWAALAATGAGLFFFHVTAPILAAGGALAFYATAGRRHGRGWHAAVLGAAALTVVVNLPWLVELWRFRGIRTAGGQFLTADSALFLVGFFLQETIEGRTALALLVLGLGGLASWPLRGRGAAAAAFGGSILVLLALTGLGSLWGPTKALEPLRFRVAFLFLLAVPAGSAVAGLSGTLARWAGEGRRGGVAVALAWLASLASWGALDRTVSRWYGQLLSEDRPLVVGLRPEMTRLVEWIRANTDPSARILFEDQLRLLEATDPESVHWTPLLPRLLGADRRMFIGGLYQTAFIRHHQQAAFGDFQLGDRPIDEWSPPAALNYCDRYNVGWVVCWSPLSRYYFDRFGPAKRVATLPRHSTPGRPVSTNQHEWEAMIRGSGVEVARRYMVQGDGAYAIYRVDRPRSYFARGRGRVVDVGPNRIELADVEPEGGAVVLKFHWLQTWKSEPPLALRPEPAGPDPVPFLRIELHGPAPRVVLTNGYGR